MEKDKELLPHHEKLTLCTTRLPYRQGRKLTAIKTYTINNESKHLLIFGVPSLNLKREIKTLFVHFGKLVHFAVTEKYVKEPFTENYYAIYDRIQSARIAKKMVDAKNFYGGILHICYAPEMETLDDVREKLLLRKREVYRQLKIKNIDKRIEEEKKPQEDVERNVKTVCLDDMWNKKK